MKTIFKLVLMLLIASSSASGQNAYNQAEVEKKKSITQTYDLSGSDRVSLSNKFGDIKINTWAESKVKVDVEIEVNAKTEDKANKMLDGITISHSKTNGQVIFKTKMEGNIYTGNMNGGDYDNGDEESNNKGKSKEGKKWNNQSMKINYTVYLPTNTTLKLYNEFGNMNLPNYAGALDARNKFGNFIADNLSNADNEILVEFGSADIKSITKPGLTVKFGNCDVANVVGNGVLNFEFSGDINIVLDKSVGDLKIKNSYSEIELTLNENTNATFDVKSSYGEVKNKNKNLSMKSDEDEEDENRGCCDFTKNHKGTIGNGAAKININNSYGKVKFR
jgi:Putative adhesin